MSYTDEEVKEKLLSNIKVVGDCWEWQKYVGKKGYGYMRLTDFGGKGRFKWRVHRLSYMIFKGDIPGGMFICHTCDNPCCVNPDHLFLGTHQDNMDDMNNKGRGFIPDFTGLKHSEETKLKMSESNTHQKGENNSQYGTAWLCNDLLKKNKRVSKENLSIYLIDGWYRGRNMEYTMYKEVV